MDIKAIREQFPVLHQQVHGKPLVYLDNAATTQKPASVIEALVAYYKNDNANIHRGIHTLAERATMAFETTRDEVRQFIGARHREEVIFTRGTTEGINLIAATIGKQRVRKGDEILVSAMEHHSNMVPWQMLATEKEATLKIIPINEAGELDIQAFHSLLSEKTKIVSVVHASNALGTVNPIQHITEAAHQVGAIVVVDGAQSASHLDINVEEWKLDFFVFSGHKIYGPTGIGVMYGRKELLLEMPPYMGGGEMIGEVRYDGFTTNELPYKFEAGTPNIADTIALAESIRFINKIGKESIRAHEDDLLQYATERLLQFPEIKLIGTAKNKVSICSFIVEGVHHQDLGILLDQAGIAIRTGHHCTMPLMHRMGLKGTSRASFAIYNTREEIDALELALKKSIKMLK
ncbi:MAG: cysteine desulfurase [Cytophagaceae bacterium]|nr:cysteine desulfurase [Cytophagaceae bacterium]